MPPVPLALDDVVGDVVAPLVSLLLQPLSNADAKTRQDATGSNIARVFMTLSSCEF
jgi:hypothetical protein